ncbi:MAG: hypothetical protein J2O49_05965 [Sciscionella sp.]|nr:hypothetical protein [Sciscionella sp.]
MPAIRSASSTSSPVPTNDAARPTAVAADGGHVDASPCGLRVFNLGGVPASVTPPRTSRRAALFIGGTSTAVLVLLFLLSALVTNPPKRTGDIALPQPQLPQLPLASPSPSNANANQDRQPQGVDRGDVTGAHDRGSPAVDDSSSAAGSIGDGSQTNQTADGGAPTIIIEPTRSSGAPTDGSSGGMPSGGSSGAPTDGGTSAAPPDVSVQSGDPVLSTPVDGNQIADITQRYYAAVVSDPSEAYGMTGGAMRIEGQQAMSQRYADVKSISVKEIDADPNDATTTNEVTVTHTDGTVHTERHTLRFSFGNDPKITDDDR